MEVGSDIAIPGVPQELMRSERFAGVARELAQLLSEVSQEAEDHARAQVAAEQAETQTQLAELSAERNEWKDQASVAASEAASAHAETKKVSEHLDQTQANLDDVLDANRTIAEAATKAARVQSLSTLQQLRRDLEASGAPAEAIAKLDASIDELRG